MEILITIFLIIWLHFIADFILQSTDMGTKKSKDIGWLITHCCLYAIPFVILGWKFAAIAGLSHFCIDFITSKITSKLWEKKEVHWFFVAIGFDQALHMSVFLILIKYNI